MSISPFPLNYLSCVRFVCLLSLNQVKPRLVNTVCRSDVSSRARANKKICQTRLRAVKGTVARKVMNYTNESRWICFGLGQFPARRLQIPGGRRFLSPFQGGRAALLRLRCRAVDGPDQTGGGPTACHRYGSHCTCFTGIKCFYCPEEGALGTGIRRLGLVILSDLILARLRLGFFPSMLSHANCTRLLYNTISCVFLMLEKHISRKKTKIL